MGMWEGSGTPGAWVQGAEQGKAAWCGDCASSRREQQQAGPLAPALTLRMDAAAQRPLPAGGGPWVRCRCRLPVYVCRRFAAAALRVLALQRRG